MSHTDAAIIFGEPPAHHAAAVNVLLGHQIFNWACPKCGATSAQTPECPGWKELLVAYLNQRSRN